MDYSPIEYASLGMDYQTKELFDKPINEDDLISKLLDSGKGLIAKGMGNDFLGKEKGMLFDEKIIWSYIVHSDDPNKDEIIEIISRLANFHEMDIPDEPLEFDVDEEFEWHGWIQRNYNLKFRPKTRPNHILIVATPKQIPFGFQSRLSKKPRVGRICFDSICDLENYVDKVIKLSENPPVKLKRHSSFFATDYGKMSNGKYDVTHYSYNELVTPLKQFLETENIPVKIAKLDDVKKTHMLQKLKSNKSALVFFAGHGIGNVSKDKQLHLQGAFCCQDWIETKNDSELFSASDISYDEPFLEGAMVVNFSCFGYGTPKLDDIVNFSFGGDRFRDSLADEAFMAALPKRLLAHPKGPLGYIGHANSLYLSGFYNTNPSMSDDFKRDISPFETIVDYLFRNDTLGKSIEDMNETAAMESDRFSDAILRFQGGDKNRETKREIANSFFQSHDFDNYLIFGDPAIRLNI